MKPQQSVSRADPRAASSTPSVGNYEAVASVAVIRSSFRCDELTRKARSKLTADPGYAAWPSATFAERGITLSQLHDDTLVLARLKLVFDFSAGITAESSVELSRAIDHRWPELAEARAALLNGTGTVAYAQAAVTAEVNAEGEPRWGFVGNVNDGQPLPLGYTASEGQRPEFDAYLQNLIRLDLQQRIEKRLA